VKTRDFPQFLLDLLDTPPHAGEGVHHWLFRVARHLHAHLPAVEIMNLLESRVQGCGRHVIRKEIEDAVRNSFSCAWKPHGASAAIKRQPKWPGINLEQRKAVVRDYGRLADLWNESRLRFEDSEQHTEEILDLLFPGNPLLCCAKTQSVFDTRPREEWRGKLSALSLIVPSPMSALLGVTKEGTESKHTLDNTGPRRFLICEFDSGTVDEQAALLRHLGTITPLILAVHSGGKSLHGWFDVHEEPEPKVEKFFRYAVSLGADPKMWTRSQFARMPDGTRDNGKHQTVFFINHKPLETP
jgi:hypothetical protein